MRTRNVSEEFVEKVIKHFIVNNVISKIVPFTKWREKILSSWSGHMWQYGARA